MDWNSRLKDTFDYVRDANKQVLALASTVLGASVTLYGTMVRNLVVTKNDLIRLRLAWALLALSVLMGVVALFMAVRVTSPKDKSGDDNPIPSVYDAGLRIWSGLQFLCFVIGMAFFAGFGWQLIDNGPRP